jgi:hypothetical protein
VARRFSRKSKDLLKALRRLGYTLHPGGLTEDQLAGTLDGTFTEADYRALVASRTREELLRLILGRRFRS